MSHTNGEDKNERMWRKLAGKTEKISKIFVVRSGGDAAGFICINIWNLKENIPDELFVYADEETDWETFFDDR